MDIVLANDEDYGSHVVCRMVTEDFLIYTKYKGNDLITPRRNFAGLRHGDYLCLCAFRYEEARLDEHAPKILLESTHKRALDLIPLDELDYSTIKETGKVKYRRII